MEGVFRNILHCGNKLHLLLVANSIAFCFRVSITVLDYIEKAKAAAGCAREYSLEARELVREMYPDFEQPGTAIIHVTLFFDDMLLLPGAHIFNEST